MVKLSTGSINKTKVPIDGSLLLTFSESEVHMFMNITVDSDLYTIIILLHYCRTLSHTDVCIGKLRGVYIVCKGIDTSLLSFEIVPHGQMKV